MLPILALASLTALVPVQELSLHVPTKDGTRLAVDVYLPPARADDARGPALLELTRYGRAREEAQTGKPIPALEGLDRALLAGGYALIKVDVRGTGASFGTRVSEYGQQEVRDGYDVVEWVVQQPWCDGKVGAYGTSYSGTTAELLTAAGHPAVRAVVVGWSDFDDYRSPSRPYGLFAEQLIEEWGALVGVLDRNDVATLGSSVRRVQADSDGALLRAAVAEHAHNPAVAAAVRQAEFRDQRVGGDTWAETTAVHWKKSIEASGAAMLVFASWFDSGTAEGALKRFQHFSNPQKLVILASDHGGATHASPYVVARNLLPARPDAREQVELRRAFFDHHLKGAANGVADWPAIRYFNLGAETMLESSVWPPVGVERRRLFLAAEGFLAEDCPSTRGTDAYAVDFGVSTGTANRWATQMGRPVLGLDDREDMDERMLVYTGAPLEHDLQLAGTPTLRLYLRADRADCAVLAYLEDVAPNGRSRYLTEGGLRALHRKLDTHAELDDGLPEHTFAAADALALVPGATAELDFRMHPLAVLVRAGHSLRLALAGADADTFARLPEAGAVSLSVLRGGAEASVLELPIVRAAAAEPAKAR
ncbi:MAG: CocE/NonD family hydrolase [Planctomycetes bacterium]|nr:CocE/NonD family hydrolase [Planctomycetota bacterium]